MQATHLIDRMAVSPDPIGWYNREKRRRMLYPMQPVDDPGVVIVRPYGIAKGLGQTTFPVDYTLMHYGGTLRGAKIGQWKDSLLVSTEPQPVNAPTQFSWRQSRVISRVGQYWTPDESDSWTGSVEVL